MIKIKFYFDYLNYQMNKNIKLIKIFLKVKINILIAFYSFPLQILI